MTTTALNLADLARAEITRCFADDLEIRRRENREAVAAGDDEDVQLAAAALAHTEHEHQQWSDTGHLTAERATVVLMAARCRCIQLRQRAALDPALRPENREACARLDALRFWLRQAGHADTLPTEAAHHTPVDTFTSRRTHPHEPV